MLVGDALGESARTCTGPAAEAVRGEFDVGDGACSQTRRFVPVGDILASDILVGDTAEEEEEGEEEEMVRRWR